MKTLFQSLCLSLLLMTWGAFADNSPVLGQWKTIDDETGKPKSIVELYEQNGKIYGRINKLFLDASEDPDPLCTKCTGKSKDQKIIGMVILENLEKQGDEWSGGTILDPEKGKTYNCKIWVEEGKLKVRGYLSVFFRTQTWHRVE